MKRLIFGLALMISFTVSQSVQASCLDQYEKLISDLNGDTGRRVGVAVCAGGLGGAGVSALALSTAVFAPFSAGAIVGGVTTKGLMDRRVNRLSTVRDLLKGSYESDEDPVLTEESLRLSKKMEKNITARDLAGVIVRLDSSDIFCKDEKPLNLKKVRKLIEAELQTQK